MDGNLMQMFNSGNPFLVNSAYDQLAAGAKRGEADLAKVLFETDAARQRLPVELAQTRANTGNLQQLTREKTLANDVVESVPLADRSAAYFGDLRKKLQDQELGQLDSNMKALRHYLSMAEAGPLDLNTVTSVAKQYPGMERFLSSPQGIAAGKKAYEAYVRSSPEFMRMDAGKEADYKRAIEQAEIRAGTAEQVARLRIEAEKQAREARLVAKAGEAKGATTKMNYEQQVAYYTELERNATTPEEKKLFRELADQAEVRKLRLALLRAQAAKGGSPDLSDPKLNIPTIPMPEASPTPRGGQPAPGPVQLPGGWVLNPTK